MSIAQRTATLDSTPITTGGRFAILGATNYTDAVAQVDFRQNVINPSDLAQGVVLRWTDINNFVFALAVHSPTPSLVIYKRKAGTVDAIVSDLIPGYLSGLTQSVWYTVRLYADIGGRCFAWIGKDKTNLGEPLLEAQDADLATGGTLATGKPGFYDCYNASAACTRDYDNLSVWVPTRDAAIFASQSLQLREDNVVREDSGGTLWPKVSRYEGDYLTIPPAGQEARTTRIIVKASRNDPDTMSDPAIDDVSARLTYTPRGLLVPEP
jgi:hypothetical protein